MTRHMTGTREEWLAARLALLDAEKELTRRSDELARQRQELPWVRVDKAYRFEIEEGSASLADLFRGRSQLLVYHFMFGPDYAAGCPSCSAIADGFNGFAAHLASHDVTLSAVSRAPLAKLEAYKQRMGWTFPWASSFGGDFNADFNVWFTEEQQRDGDDRMQLPPRDGGRPERARRAEDGAIARGFDEKRRQTAGRTDRGPCGTDVATFTRERPGCRARSCSRTASSTTPIPRIRGDLTPSGACTNGSTAPQEGATRRASGGGATTSTAGAEPQRRADERSVARWAAGYPFG